jgi:hypothetical protein
MQFLLLRVKIIFVIFLFTMLFMSDLSATVLRFQRNINWIEEKNITFIPFRWLVEEEH